MPIYSNLNLIFIHIPKTGGSSINEYFNLKKMMDMKSIKGDFICEQKLPGFVRGHNGKRYVISSENLKGYLSKGDFIRIDNFIYQIHTQKEFRNNKIFLSGVDDAHNLMKGHIACREVNFLGNNGKHKIWKKLVSDHQGNKIIPSIFHWGWIVTRTSGGKRLKQVRADGTIIENGSPALELDHVSASYIQSRIDPQVFQNYYKFAFVRNPYDRIVSEYFWKIKDNDTRLGIQCQNMNFAEFVYLLADKFDNLLNYPHYEVSHFLPQYLFVYDTEDNLIVDLVWKYEDGLDKGIKQVYNELGFPNGDDIHLPIHNTTKHKRKKYTEYYTPELQQLVYLMYEKDFELFGYSKEFN